MKKQHGDRAKRRWRQMLLPFLWVVEPSQAKVSQFDLAPVQGKNKPQVFIGMCEKTSNSTRDKNIHFKVFSFTFLN